MEDRELAMKILQVIIDDMGGLAAKKLMPKEPSIAEEMTETPEEENAETAAEEVQEIEAGVDENLPRWKRRMKQV